MLYLLETTTPAFDAFSHSKANPTFLKVLVSHLSQTGMVT
jgi:hypothetical protein